MRLRDRMSLSGIAKRTGLSRNTVKKWLKQAKAAVPKYQRGDRPGKLTVFEEQLEQALQADCRRPKRDRCSARALFAQVKGDGYGGGYTLVSDFIRGRRQAIGQSRAGRAFVPLKFELGEAFQFDWSEEGLVVGGIYYRSQVSHMKLCASRAFWLVAYPSQGHELLFDAHTRSFAGLGGIALVSSEAIFVTASIAWGLIRLSWYPPPPFHTEPIESLSRRGHRVRHERRHGDARRLASVLPCAKIHCATWTRCP